MTSLTDSFPEPGPQCACEACKEKLQVTLIRRSIGVEVAVTGGDPDEVADTFDKLSARYSATPGYRGKTKDEDRAREARGAMIRNNVEKRNAERRAILEFELAKLRESNG